MNFKKIFTEWKWTIVALILILAVGLGLRITSLTILPIFVDEAIYVRWAQVMKAEPTLRFLPLSDGKQPLFMWLLMFLLKPNIDPLIIGRILSVFFGIATNCGIFVAAYLLFRSKRVSLAASFMHAVSPFMIFFESMALVDAALSAFGIWFFVFINMSVRFARFDLSMISGFALGSALLTKSPALYFTILAPVTFIIEGASKNLAKSFLKILKSFIYLIPVFLIGYGMYNILRLGPNFHLVSQRNADYIFPISHLWENPKDPFIFHVKEVGEWMWALGPGVLIFSFILGIFVGIKKYATQTLILSFWVLLPLFANAMYAKVFTARYILFVLPFIYIISALFVLFKTKYQKFIYLLLILFAVNSLLVDFLLIIRIEEAPLPKSERTGYLEEWTAGYGIKETAQFFKEYQKNNPTEKIVVGTEGYFGTLPDGLQLYLSDYPQITVIGIGLSIKETPNQLRESKNAGNRTYLVINSSRLVGNPKDMGLEIIQSYPKPLRTPNTNDYSKYGLRETMYLFEVK